MKSADAYARGAAGIAAGSPTIVPPRRRRRPRTRTQRRQAISRLVLIPMAVLYTIPYYWMAITALKSNEELGSTPPTLWPHSFQWSNFSDAVTAIPFGQYLVNTLIITGFIVPVFFGNAFWIFLMRQFLMQIPAEISDAARLDGANEIQVAYQIILPLAKPAIAVVAIFAAISAWNDFLGPLLYLQDENKYTLSVGLTFFRSQHDVQFNLLMAASTLVVLPVIIIFIAFQRSFIDGLTVGSIK